MEHRISFTLVGASDNRVHVVRKMGELPLCGAIPMAFHKLINLDEMRRSTFCPKCQAFYHQRSEREFSIIK